MRILFIIILFLNFSANAQNLVPNGNFDSIYPVLPCPQYDELKFWFNPTSGIPHGSPDFWYSNQQPLLSPLCSSSSVPNNFGGHQFPKSGTAYVGIINYSNYLTWIAPPGYYREYISDSLIAPLDSGKTYCFEMYVSLGEYSIFKAAPLSVCFTIAKPSYLNTASPLPLVPQINFLNLPIDTTNWIRLNATYTAQGHEQFITIGNFRDSANTIVTQIKPSNPNIENDSYWYIDNVSLVEQKPAYAGKDTLINCGDSLVIGADSTVGADFVWMPNVALSNNSVAFPIASPTVSTTYTLTKTQCGVVTYDTIKVTVKNNCPITPTITPIPLISEVPNIFTPNEDGINDTWRIELYGASNVSCFIYNRWGNLIYNPTLKSQTIVIWDGRTTSGEKCSEGVYYYTLEYTTEQGEVIKKKGYISLLR